MYLQKINCAPVLWKVGGRISKINTWLTDNLASSLEESSMGERHAGWPPVGRRMGLKKNIKSKIWFWWWSCPIRLSSIWTRKRLLGCTSPDKSHSFFLWCPRSDDSQMLPFNSISGWLESPRSAQGKPPAEATTANRYVWSSIRHSWLYSWLKGWSSPS